MSRFIVMHGSLKMGLTAEKKPIIKTAGDLVEMTDEHARELDPQGVMLISEKQFEVLAEQVAANDKAEKELNKKRNELENESKRLELGRISGIHQAAVREVLAKRAPLPPPVQSKGGGK